MIKYGKYITCQLMNGVNCYVLIYTCFLEFLLFVSEEIISAFVEQKKISRPYEVARKM